MKGADLRDILRAFCAVPCEEKSYMGQPFSDKHHTYATDGHIMVRVARVPECDAPVPEYFVSRLGEGNLSFRHMDIAESEWLPIPVIGIAKTRCNDCEGSGYVKDCPECDGKGEVEWETPFNSYVRECKTCEGEETIPGQAGDKVCPNCRGEGKSYPWNAAPLEVGNVLFNVRLLALLADLPGAKIYPVIWPDESKNPDPSLFKFDGGEGFIMPRRK